MRPCSPMFAWLEGVCAFWCSVFDGGVTRAVLIGSAALVTLALSYAVVFLLLCCWYTSTPAIRYLAYYCLPALVAPGLAEWLAGSPQPSIVGVLCLVTVHVFVRCPRLLFL